MNTVEKFNDYMMKVSPSLTGGKDDFLFKCLYRRNYELNLSDILAKSIKDNFNVFETITYWINKVGTLPDLNRAEIIYKYAHQWNSINDPLSDNIIKELCFPVVSGSYSSKLKTKFYQAQLNLVQTLPIDNKKNDLSKEIYQRIIEDNPTLENQKKIQIHWKKIGNKNIQEIEKFIPDLLSSNPAFETTQVKLYRLNIDSQKLTLNKNLKNSIHVYEVVNHALDVAKSLCPDLYVYKNNLNFHIFVLTQEEKNVSIMKSMIDELLSTPQLFSTNSVTNLKANTNQILTREFMESVYLNHQLEHTLENKESSIKVKI